MPTLKADGLFITRKRKKWKFAHFNSYENCFSHSRNEDPSKTFKAISEYLPKNKTFVVELAAGNAQFSLALAKRYPKKNFIAVDIKSDRLYTSAKKALEDGVSNIAFVRTQINQVGELFGKDSVDELWLTFPDPFPKKRSAKHRLTHINFLRQYRDILKEKAVLRFKTDNRELFLWSLEQFVANDWRFHELSFDLHESNLAADYKIKTYYEEKFTAQGIPTNFCSIVSER